MHRIDLNEMLNRALRGLTASHETGEESIEAENAALGVRITLEIGSNRGQALIEL